MYKRGNPRGHPAEVPIEVFLAFRIVLVTNRHLNFAEASKNLSFHFCTMLVVGLSGLEPPTSRLSGVRSNRLSYKPISRPSGSHRSALFCFARIAAHAAPALCGESPLSRLRSYHISQIQLLRSGYVVSSSGREPYLPGTVRCPMLCPRGLPRWWR